MDGANSTVDLPAVTSSTGTVGSSHPSTAHSPSSFAHFLVTSGVLSEEQVSQALSLARKEQATLARILSRDALLPSRDLAALMALHLGLPMLDLRSQTIDPQAVSTLPEEIARKYGVLPIRSDGASVTMAVADPSDLQLLQDLTARVARKVLPVIATTEEILEHIDLTYRLIEVPQGEPSAGEPVPPRPLAHRNISNAPPARIIDLLLQQALQDRASDIHIEPTESRVRVRFRIDGILHEVLSLSTDTQPTLISRLKIVSGMNIAERRRPQDGQFTFEVQSRKVDVRVAISNTVLGEMAVLRLLDKRFTLMGLDQLGMGPGMLDHYRGLLRLPYGMIIVCGPTGAGKSTTLYASILQINRTEQKVISLEDPVEYTIANVNQMQVHSEAGITFATQLRSILRLDPDVILVGEIRDQETAVIATQAALTGHLVLTSLHANDAVSALVRLRDLGVAPYLITSAVAGIVGQRMLRVVCNGCQIRTQGSLVEQRAYYLDTGEKREHFNSGSGCNMCAHTGYRGRTGVFEVLSISDSLRQMFLAEAPRHQMMDQALEDGMVPLRREGMLKVKQGITTPYEVMRVLFSLE